METRKNTTIENINKYTTTLKKMVDCKTVFQNDFKLYYKKNSHLKIIKVIMYV